MRYVMLLIAAATLAGCATKNVTSHVQDYRPRDQETPVAIQGAVTVKPGVMRDEYTFMARMDNVTRLYVPLSDTGNGELFCKAGESTATCDPLPNRGIGASCTGSKDNGRIVRINCSVFVDNERAAAFTF